MYPSFPYRFSVLRLIIYKLFRRKLRPRGLTNLTNNLWGVLGYTMEALAWNHLNWLICPFLMTSIYPEIDRADNRILKQCRSGMWFEGVLGIFWHDLCMSVVDGTCPIAARAHYTGRNGVCNHDPEICNGVEPQRYYQFRCGKKTSDSALPCATKANRKKSGIWTSATFGVTDA